MIDLLVVQGTRRFDVLEPTESVEEAPWIGTCSQVLGDAIEIDSFREMHDMSCALKTYTG